MAEDPEDDFIRQAIFPQINTQMKEELIDSINNAFWLSFKLKETHLSVW